MLIAYFLLGLATFFMLEIFQGLRDFDLVDANIIHYINISNSLPKIHNTTLTNSIRKRFSELYSVQDSPAAISAYQDFSISNPQLHSFYKKYMKTHMNKLSKTLLFADKNATFKFFALNSEWTRSEPYTNLGLYTLKDKRLYQIFTRDVSPNFWRHCFFHHIEGAAEAIAYDKDKDLLTVGFYNPSDKSHFLIYYNDLECSYRDALDTSTFRDMYCAQHTSTLCQDTVANSTQEEDLFDNLVKKLQSLAEDQDNLENLETELDENIDFVPLYDRIPLPEESHIVNMAVSKDLIVYTTLEDKKKIKCFFKNELDIWEEKVLEYPMISQNFRFHQNLGLGFITDSSKGEKQLLIVDLEGNETTLNLVYFIYKFSDGYSLLRNEKLRDHYGFESLGEIEPKKLYGSVMFELFRVEISQELEALDILQSLNLPKSIIKSQPNTNQTMVLSLQKYILLITMEEEDEMFSMYSIKDFEDQTYKVRDFDISEDGTYFAFLTNNKDKMKVFILESEVLYNGDEETLYLVNFDESLSPEQGTIKGVKLLKDVDNETILMVLLESGEIATYSLQFGVTNFHGLNSLLVGNEGDLFSIFSLIAVICMFLVIKLANLTRLHINLRQTR